MRIAICLGILAACLLAPSIAAAADGPDWYLGAELGRSTASSGPGGLGFANSFGMSIPYGDPALTTSTPASLSSSSRQVEAGVWINSYVGFQAGYLDLGTYSNGFYAHDPHNNICYGCGSPSENTTAFSDTTTVKLRGPVFVLTGRVPLPDEFELLGKVGWFAGSANYDERVTGLPNVISGASDSADYPAWDLGAGLGWRFASHWGVELWWNVYKNTKQQYYGNSSATAVTQFDVKGYSLALQYHF